MSMNLAHYLKDFSAPQPAPAIAHGMDFTDSDMLDTEFPALSQPDPVDVEAERREAYAEGHEAATRELQAQFQAERQEFADSQAQFIAVLQEKHRAETAQIVGDRLRTIAAEIAIAVSEQAAIAMAPLFTDEIAANAIKELAAMMQAAILDGNAGAIVVTGHAELFERLKAELPESDGLLRFVESNDLDLSVDIGETVLVTRISAWTASLKKVLG
ncbi:MAG: GTPase [Allorhizobium sp.]